MRNTFSPEEEARLEKLHNDRNLCHTRTFITKKLQPVVIKDEKKEVKPKSK